MTRPLRFGIDATPLLGRRTGIGRVVTELTDHLIPLLRDGEELVLSARVLRMNPWTGVSHEPLTSRARLPRVKLVRHVVPYTFAVPAGKWLPWLPLDLPAGPLDVFHGTNFTLPATKARGVATIHDLAFLRFPDQVPPDFRALYERLSRDAAARADVVVGDSDCTSRDVAELLGVDPSRTVTIHPGVSAEFLAPGDRERDAAALLARHGLAPDYVLFVGSTHPRKNLSRLLEAFAAARRRAGLAHRLVLVGDAGFGHAEVRARIASLGLDDAVTLPGYVPDEDLPALYRCAAALAFPSCYEGFGLPVVEAFATGCPVLTSSTSCLPEVAGDAAVLVDPGSTESIADGLVRILTDVALRARLVEAGRSRVGLFTWEKAARAHLDLYRRLAEARRNGAPLR